MNITCDSNTLAAIKVICYTASIFGVGYWIYKMKSVFFIKD